MNRSMWRKFVALGVVLVLGSAAGVLAQQETGNVFANVKDTNGNPLPGVTCELSGLGAPRIQVSNAAGEVRWLSLDPGAWALECSLEGFSTVEYPNIDVRVGRNVTLEVALTEAIGEVITVTSESPLLDERKIQTGTSVTQVELETIPTARDPWAILNQTPGVMVDRINVGGAESGQQSVFTGPGVSDDENTFMIDGVEITDMAAVGSSATYYDFDQYTEMQFETGGSDVSKSAAGVSVNLVTKRGTNEFRGSARFMRTDDSFFGGWLEQDVPVYTAPDDKLGPNQESFVSNSIDQVTEYGFEAGGPVVRDWKPSRVTTPFSRTPPSRPTGRSSAPTRWWPAGTTATSRSSVVTPVRPVHAPRPGISAVRQRSTRWKTHTSSPRASSSVVPGRRWTVASA